MYELRRATVKDADMLSKLWVDTFTQAYGDVHTQENIRAYCQNNFTVAHAIKELSDEKTICVISWCGPRANGFFILKAVDCPMALDGRSIELKQIYICASEYGRGLGKQLYDEVIKTAQDYSCQNTPIEWLWLSVSDINFRAQSFYKKLNFNEMGTGPTFEVGEDRLPSTIMAKRIVG